MLSHWLVRTFNTAAATGADHTDAHTLPLLAALRATCVASRGSVSDALALLRRVRLPSDGALLAHPELLPALASLHRSVAHVAQRRAAALVRRRCCAPPQHRRALRPSVSADSGGGGAALRAGSATFWSFDL